MDESNLQLNWLTSSEILFPFYLILTSVNFILLQVNSLFLKYIINHLHTSSHTNIHLIHKLNFK